MKERKNLMNPKRVDLAIQRITRGSITDLILEDVDFPEAWGKLHETVTIMQGAGWELVFVSPYRTAYLLSHPDFPAVYLQLTEVTRQLQATVSPVLYFGRELILREAM